MILRNWNYILFALSFFTIIVALIAEYFYGLQPCELCLKQRHPYYLFIVILLFTFFIAAVFKLYIFILVQLGAAYGLFYSIWHVGVEKNLIEGPSGCSSGLAISTNTADLKAQILNKQVISCDEVIWSIFGLSAASINTIVLLFIFIINALYIYYTYAKKEN
tara:strand:+ start:186 stop:671 length:486 start_codon:yes stop_codon:yes gene_type:complete